MHQKYRLSLSEAVSTAVQVSMRSGRGTSCSQSCFAIEAEPPEKSVGVTRGGEERVWVREGGSEREAEHEMV